jgi:hypothetical protein
MKNLLGIEEYKVSRVNPRKRLNNLEKFQATLKEVAPEFAGEIIDGYKIVGKTAAFQQYVAEKDKGYFIINISRKVKGGSITSVPTEKKDISEMNLRTVKLKDVKYNPSLFVPIKADSPLDLCFSTEGGIMPATNYILFGDPGIGKSSLGIQYVAELQKNNPTKRILFISAEMTKWDMIPFTKRFPLWNDIEILFTSELTEGLYKESIEAKLQEGWDLVLTDSFAELTDSVRGDYNDQVAGKNKKTYPEMEKWFIDLMVHNNGAENDKNINSSFISIQQVTKGGDFVGSNKLNHNTTGMLALRYTKSGSRKIHIKKNRRGFEYQDLEFSFTEDSENPIFYNTARIARDKEIKNEIQKVQAMQLDDEEATDSWITTMGDDLEHQE